MEKTSPSRKKIITAVAVIAAIIVVVLLLSMKGCAGNKNTDTAEQKTAKIKAASDISSVQAGSEASTEDAAEIAESTSAEEEADEAASEDSRKGDPKKKEAGDGKTADQKQDEEKKETKEEKENKEDKKPANGTPDKKMCKITVNNGAASANTSEAVNGLHVYLPDSADKEDLFSGQEIEAGTKVSVFVYNMSTPVTLTIEHNGAVIASRTYSVLEPFVDDDKVEFFNIVLEGDLVVTTTALAAGVQAESTLHINNEALGQTMVGGVEVHDGEKLRNGAQDFVIKRNGYDVTVTLYVDGAAAGSAELTENSPTAEFKNISFNNSEIKVEFAAIDRAEPTPEPPKKSTISVTNGDLAKIYRGSAAVANGDVITNGTYDFRIVSDKKDVNAVLSVGGTKIGEAKINAGMNEYTFQGVAVTADVSIVLTDVTPESEETEFKITIENKVKSKDGQLTVGYVNEKDEPVMVTSGKKYEKGLMIGARVLNTNATRKLKLTAYDADGKKIDSVTAAVGSTAHPGANGFYFALNSEVRLVLNYADAGKTPTPTPIPTKTPKPTKTPVPTKTPTPSVTPEETTVKVTVTNGAADANTDSAVNGLHVYATNIGNDDDIIGTKKLKTGTKITIFAYPQASDIHMKIVHNGKTIYDKDIAKMKAWVDDDKVEYIKVTLKGDLKVTTTVKGSATPTPTVTVTPTPTVTVTPTPTVTVTPTPTVTVTPTPTPTVTPEPVSEYTVVITDQTDGEGIDYTVGYVDFSGETPQQIVLKSGDKVEEGTAVGARVINDSEKTLILKLLNSAGAVLDETQIAPGDVSGLYVDFETGITEDIEFVLAVWEG